MAEGQPETGADKRKAIILIIIVLFAGICIYTYARYGFLGFKDFISRILTWMIVLAVFGGIVYLVFKILQRPKVDLVATTMNDIIDAGTYSKPPMLKDIYFTGDREHGEFKVGKIIGYCQIQSYKDLNKISELTVEQIAKFQRDARAKGMEWDPSNFLIPEDCFIWKKMMWPFSLFEQPKVLRVLEDEHSQLVGDVKIFAVSMIKKYGYYWPNRAYLDIARVDHAIIKEAWRGHIHEFLKDEVAIARRSVGMDASHQKALEERKLLKIPSPLGEQEGRGG